MFVVSFCWMSGLPAEVLVQRAAVLLRSGPDKETPQTYQEQEDGFLWHTMTRFIPKQHVSVVKIVCDSELRRHDTAESVRSKPNQRKWTHHMTRHHMILITYAAFTVGWKLRTRLKVILNRFVFSAHSTDIIVDTLRVTLNTSRPKVGEFLFKTFKVVLVWWMCVPPTKRSTRFSDYS